MTAPGVGPVDPAHPVWAAARVRIAEAFGLDFPRHRTADLVRGITSAAQELGLGDGEALATTLAVGRATPDQLRIVASHLTVAETYLFRDRRIFDVLAATLLPPLIARRRQENRTLRLWSAGCASGEEVYSLAIILHDALPDLTEWHVQILGTDLNPRVLHKAAQGTYGEWSFRGVDPSLRARCFGREADAPGESVRHDLKSLVRFEEANLVQQPPSGAPFRRHDVILCRNVLMYFTPTQMQRAADLLTRSLADGGWLIVGGSETSDALFGGLERHHIAGHTFYRRDDTDQRAPRPSSVDTSEIGGMGSLQPPGDSWRRPRSRRPDETAARLYRAGRYAEAVNALTTARCEPSHAATWLVLVRALARSGRTGEALYWARRWTVVRPLESCAHYVHAVVLLTQGLVEPARESLRRALCLRPCFAEARLMLAELASCERLMDDADGLEANPFGSVRLDACSAWLDAVMQDATGARLLRDSPLEPVP